MTNTYDKLKDKDGIVKIAFRDIAAPTGKKKGNVILESPCFHIYPLPNGKWELHSINVNPFKHQFGSYDDCCRAVNMLYDAMLTKIKGELYV